MQRKTIILTFDDALRNHLEFVAPILKKYNFGATFYVCEFPDAQNFGESPYLNWKQIAELSGMGFEIGNHTKSHCDCRKISGQDFLAELTYIEEKCREHAIAPPRTFAYPGGPVAENVIGILKERGYVTARSCGDTTFDPQRDDRSASWVFPFRTTPEINFSRRFSVQQTPHIRCSSSTESPIFRIRGSTRNPPASKRAWNILRNRTAASPDEGNFHGRTRRRSNVPDRV